MIREFAVCEGFYILGIKMANGKDPAFLFYYTAFDNGTKYMTDEEVGVYTRLLCEQADKWNITPRIFNRIVGDRPSVKETLLEKFKTESDGNYFNPRLREEQLKRKKYTDSRLMNFHKKHHMGVDKGSDMDSHTKDKDIDINKDDLVLMEVSEKIWRTVYLSNPGEVELNFVFGLIGKFGEKRTKRIIMELREEGFKKISTMKKALNPDGTIKPKENEYKKEGKTVVYNPPK